MTKSIMKGILSELASSILLSLAFLWAVDAAETDAFSAVAVQDFDGVAIQKSMIIHFAHPPLLLGS